MSESVSVLGTKYKIKVVNIDAIPENVGGICDVDLHEILILDLKSDPEWKDESDEKITARQKNFLRHEIVHAFFNESGLRDNCAIPQFSWACNEEMVDWIASQGPKIYKAWQEAEAL